MITADQLKDVMERAEALHHYLNIDQKQMELEEEQLRTQALISGKMWSEHRHK